ncbi:uncharacterized protein LAJ45_00051 [Morchella importuna]|uniref:uncharacterized protein n=1 Tax=Morchella importuna TaxID=1174673 RepID=UPI001E8D3E11|nr:uncharacterized protein LAJ45_00051 [Morchella importuna]KAH8155043.1 hypothetical protein LAJ45_00051 [Morchella importuna]
MTTSITPNDHFPFNGAAGDLVSNPGTNPTSLSPFAETVRILRKKRNRSFHLALLKRNTDYNATKKESMLGRFQNLDFHHNAVHAQSKEIALVANYGLTDKQQRDLYDGLGYTGLHRFLEEPDNAIFSLSPVGSNAESPINPSEPEAVEVAPQTSSRFEVGVENVCVATRKLSKGASFVVVGKILEF